MFSRSTLLAALLWTLPAFAAPLDLGDEDSSEENAEESPDLSRGAAKPKGDGKAPATSVIDEFEFEEPVESFDTEPGLPEDEFSLLEDPAAPAAAPKVVEGPPFVRLDVAGKAPHADNYPLSVVAVDRDAVVVEIPVLLARARVEVLAPYTLQATFFVGGVRATEVSQRVEPASAAEFGPTFAFLKAMVPVVERSGEVKVEVRLVPAKGEPTLLLTRTTGYTL